MGQAQGGVIARLKPGGIAHELGLEVGDRIAAINGHRLQDLIDYRFHLADEVVEVSVLKKNGEEWLLDIEKDPDDDLGVGFTSQVFDGIKTCRNRCLFCFVEQMPRGMRPPLYVKDDDYRLSFLHGNFISLTNLSPEEMERIKGQRLSPLHISVHATDPGLRATMMGSPQAGRIMKQLQELIAAGIDLHAQVVLCPGLNDGPQLKRTVTELSGLWPGLRSLAVVPVGLTRHRQRLYPLRTFTREEARTIVQQVADWQEEFRQRFSYTFVFLADEFYLLAGEDFPPYETYEDFPQWENGVGMAADFLRNLDEVLGSLSVGAGKKAPPAMPTSANVSQGTSTRNSARAARPGPWTLITGRSAQDLIKKMAEGFNQRFEGVNLDVLPVVNGFFGPTVSVTGLLTGQDILAAARNVRPRGLLLPEVMLREGHFLDDMTLPELSTQLGVPVQAVPSNPSGLAGFLLGDR